MLRLESAVPRPQMRPERDVLPAPVVFPVSFFTPPLRLLPCKKRCEWQPVALSRDLEAHRFADGREEVDILGERFHGCAVRLGATWITHDSNDVVAGLEEAALAQKSLITELLAVVGGDENERVVPHSHGYESVE